MKPCGTSVTLHNPPSFSSGSCSRKPMVMPGARVTFPEVASVCVNGVFVLYFVSCSVTNGRRVVSHAYTHTQARTNTYTQISKQSLATSSLPAGPGSSSGWSCLCTWNTEQAVSFNSKQLRWRHHACFKQCSKTKHRLSHAAVTRPLTRSVCTQDTDLGAQVPARVQSIISMN